MDEEVQPAGKKRPLRLAETKDEIETAGAKRAAIGVGPEDAKKPAPLGKQESLKQGQSKSSRRKSGSDPKKRTADQLNFPEKLMQLINDNVAPEHVSWIDSEEAICFKADGFQQHVLDKFFQGLKYDSFVRKLNRWGFRRVTSAGVPAGTVAYYHNSFRKEEQDLLRTMGIGKKNDPEVRDLEAFGGERSLIGSAGAAMSAAGTSIRSEPSLALAGAPYAGGRPQEQRYLSSVMHRQQLPTGTIDHQISGVATALLSAGGLPASTRQESKADSVAVGALSHQLMDSQQLLLEATLARQRQTDAASLHEREASMLAESILLQRSQQQQRANAAISSALANSNDDTLALRLAALAAQSASQPRSYRSQLPQPELNPRVNDPALELLLRQRLQPTTNPTSANLGIGLRAAAGANLPLNLNPLLGGVGANVNTLRGTLNPNIQGTLNQLANAAANANTQGNADLEAMWRLLLQNRQRDRSDQGRGGQGQGPPR